MSNFSLGINTGFAVNRYSEPEEWIRIVGEQLGLCKVQLTADMLSPDLPPKIILEYVKRTTKACNHYGVQITSTSTGAFTRVNHLAHPDPAVRKHWISWFKRFVDLTVDLGAASMGSHFGIFTHKDNSNPVTRKQRRKENITCWHEIGAYADKKGLNFLSWEPMSIRREQGETLVETKKLHKDVNRNSPIPFKLCLDVDHGDVSSKNPKDTDPYSWLSAFAHCSPQVHIKQSSADKGGHWPFTREYNKNGRIIPEKVISTLENNGSKGAELILEISFREREPFDSNVIDVLIESVNYWKNAIPN